MVMEGPPGSIVRSIHSTLLEGRGEDGGEREVTLLDFRKHTLEVESRRVRREKRLITRTKGGTTTAGAYPASYLT